MTKAPDSKARTMCLRDVTVEFYTALATSKSVSLRITGDSGQDRLDIPSFAEAVPGT